MSSLLYFTLVDFSLELYRELPAGLKGVKGDATFEGEDQLALN